MCRRKRYRKRAQLPRASSPASSVPGVSILRPLKGLDTNLYENLESTFTQEYPNYEIFLCVADENDQALPVVNDLIAKYPDVNAHVMIGTYYEYTFEGAIHSLCVIRGRGGGCQPENQQPHPLLSSSSARHCMGAGFQCYGRSRHSSKFCQCPRWSSRHPVAFISPSNCARSPRPTGLVERVFARISHRRSISKHQSC